MPIITLNGIDFDGKFDSSLPTSYVCPHVARVLMRLDDVVVTTMTFLGQKDSIISCVLNFTVFERLVSDCVLGADFFTHMSGHLLRCSSIHQINDDKYSYFMIDMICALDDIASCLYKREVNGIVKMVPFLISHGLSIDSNEYFTETYAQMFFYHILYGMCAYGESSHCCMASGLSPIEISRRMFSIVLFTPFSVLSMMCQSLGSIVDFEHRSCSPCDVLRDYKIQFSSFKQLPAQEFFFHVRTSTSSSDLDLFLFSAVHGLLLTTNVDDMRESLLHHLCYGKCFQEYRFKTPVGCLGIQSDNCDICHPDHFQVAFLHEAIETLTLKRLKLVLNYYQITYNSEWNIRQLRHHVQLIIDSLRINNFGTTISSKESPLDVNSDYQKDQIQKESWPQILSDESKKKLVKAFKCDTSSIALKFVTCACCGENVLKTESHEISVNEIDLNLFRSQTGNVPMKTPFLSGPYKDLLICPNGINKRPQLQDSLIICSTCLNYLQRGRQPCLALANDTYVGEMPIELQDLTFVEELMIGLCRAKCSIFQLRENKHEGLSPISQTGFRGHIIIYPQNPSSIASFLPPYVEEITSLICIIFIGSSKPTLKWLHEKAKPLAVRACKVRNALVWLKRHNTLYQNIVLNETVLDSLPENGILPFHIEHISPKKNQDSLTSTYDNLRDFKCGENQNNEIAFEKLIITDVEGHTTSQDLRVAALNHIQKKGGSYLTIPHDPNPECEFNNPSLLPKMYPTLFPYGVGGFEDENRKYKISFKRHVKHLLQLNDKRFQEHHSFGFIVFNMLQRRTVLLYTHLRMKRSGFENTARNYDEISSETLSRVTERFSKGQFHYLNNEEDNRVHQLMRDIHLINSHVPGSSSSRLQMRNEIRALTTYLGIPSFFITINPADVYCPILKYLALQNFDIDNMTLEEIPNYWEQALLISKNPYLAAHFFNIFMEIFIKTLLVYNPLSKKKESGILGYINGYYGCVEAQGRGSLHCHMLIWVEGSFNPDDLKKKIMTDDTFCKKLISYLEDTISTSVPTNPNSHENIIVPSDNLDPSSIRGVNKGLQYIPNEEEHQKDLNHVVERCQRHVHNATCFKYWKGPPDPKECRFELDIKNTNPKTTVDDITGEISYQHIDGMINNFNLTITEALRCNTDIKFIGSGASAKAILYYVTDYIAKHQLNSHITYTLIGAAIEKIEMIENESDDVKKCGKQLLQKCAHALISQQELSGQQVASYLLDYGDHFTSHSFKPLYWIGFEKYVNRLAPSPECYVNLNPSSNSLSTTYENQSSSINQNEFQNNTHHINVDQNHMDVDENNNNWEDNDEIRISVDNDKLVINSPQQADYIFRNSALDFMTLWDFCAQTEKEKKDPTRCKLSSTKYDRALLSSFDKERPSFPFMKEHDQYSSHVLKIKHPHNRCVPTLIGSPPRVDQEEQLEKYSRFILILFKPWKHIKDLRRENEKWSSAFETFSHSSQYIQEYRNIVTNMQVLHECKDSHDHDFANRIQRRRNQNDKSNTEDYIRINTTETEANDIDNNDESLSIIHHLNMIEACFSEKHNSLKNNAIDCINYAESAGMFDISNQFVNNRVEGTIQLIDLQHPHSYDKQTEWKNEYDDRKKKWKSNAFVNLSQSSDFFQVHNTDLSNSQNVQASVSSMEINNSMISRLNAAAHSSNFTSIISSSSADNVSCPNVRIDPEKIAKNWTLDTEQYKAYQIIVDHATSPFEKKPIRMFLNGPAGTGKSRIINALKDFFDERLETRKFRLSSYMGIAARNINGMTLHQLLCLRNNPSAHKNPKVLEELKNIWEGVEYLFIDEVSMIGCKFLYKISQTLSQALGNVQPFGGLSVIFAGDFAQLPPVKSTRLYARVNTRTREQTTAFQETVAGKMLWLSVNTIIELKHLHRQEGIENLNFQNLLSRMREGRCNTSDYKLLNTRIISQSINIDFSKPPWQLAPIIVYDNATKDLLNIKAAEAFAHQTNQELQWYYASDFYKKKLVEDDALIEAFKNLHSGETNQRLTRIPLALEMPILVCHNFSVEDGIVNGARGTIKNIQYHIDDHGRRHLLSVIVHIPDSSSTPFLNLSSHEFPILSDSTTFQMIHPYNQTRLSITRLQIPLQPAFAITAHRSEGKTFPQATVDYQSCKGTEAPYVMTSRVHSLNDLLILRPFDFKKICCRASEDFRIEKRRLSLLASHSPSQETSPLSINLEQCDLDDHELLSKTQAEIIRLTVENSKEKDDHCDNKKRSLSPDNEDENNGKKKKRLS